MPDKIALATTITKNVVGWCAGSVINTIVKNAVPALSKKDKFKLAVGAYVIGALVADKAEAWTEHQISLIVNAVEKIKKLATEEPTE